MTKPKRLSFPEPPHIGESWWDRSDPDVGTAEKTERNLFVQQHVRLQLRIKDRMVTDVRCHITDPSGAVENKFAAQLYTYRFLNRSVPYVWIGTGGRHPVDAAAHAAVADWAGKKAGRQKQLSLESDPLVQILKSTAPKKR